MSEHNIATRIKNILRGIDSFQDLRVLVIGDLILDIYEEGDVERISPEAPIPIVRLKRSFYRIGGAGNVAHIARKMGSQVTIAGLIGDDKEGEILMELLKSTGINTSGVIISPERPTTQKTRIISRGQQLLRLDKESDDEMSSSEEQAFINNLQNILQTQHFDVIIIEDYDKGVITRNVINHTKKHKGSSAVDPKERHFWDYKGFDIFKPNMRELNAAFGKQLPLELAINETFKRLTPEWLIVTMGEKGIYYRTKDKEGTVPAFAIEVADVTGAGDAVIVALSLCKAIRCNVEDACLFANLTASLVCQRIGTFAPEPHDLVHHAKALGLID